MAGDPRYAPTMGAVMTTGDPLGALFLLGGSLCILGASFSVCYAIWMRGWEGWESWSARTGLDEDVAFHERQERLIRRHE